MHVEKKLNYQQQLEKIISELDSKYTTKKPSLLLHACCAPCSSYVLEFLAPHFDITIYYYNPNIHPREEYERRLNELIDFLPRYKPAIENSVKIVKAPYNPEDFFKATNAKNEIALQTEPERGERCRRCYNLRMTKAFQYAQENNYDFFTTTLTISPHKDVNKINEIGYTLDKLEKVTYLPSDFKKNEGFKRSLVLSKEYGLYRQDYCGCIYSKLNS